MAVVRKILGYILLFAMISSGTEFYQLAKVPVMFSHFREHQAENPKITFSEFLKVHFFDPVKVDHDYERDVQLPFKNHECAQHTDFLKIYTRRSVTDQYQIFLSSIRDYCIPSSAELPLRSYFTDIWNPPKA